MSNDVSLRVKAQRLGGKLSAMVLPNLGAFMGWGILTALGIWLANDTLSGFVTPVLTYLLPVLIGVDGGKYVMTATIDDNATIIADNGEYQYKQVCNCSVDTRTSKGKPIGKKKGKLNNAYVYNLI